MAKLHPLLQAKLAALGEAEHKKLTDRAKLMNVPFWWHGPTPDNAEIYHNGTLSVVDTGAKIIGITAWHVWDAYSIDLAARPQFVCQFGPVTVVPEDLRIADDKRLELATFDLTSIYDRLQESGFVAHRPQSWPPSRPEVSDLVIYGGFPGTERVHHLVAATFPLNSVTGIVTQVTSQNVMAEVDYKRLMDADAAMDIVGFDPAGSSGGPVYRVLETDNGRGIELVAIVYEQSEAFTFMLGRHVDFVTADGQLLL
jgi:hypothetical protein